MFLDEDNILCGLTSGCNVACTQCDTCKANLIEENVYGKQFIP